jgi:uncharacterized membrane protein YjdF
MVSAWIMTALLVVSLSVFAKIMTPRLRLLWIGRADNRFDKLGERLLGTLKFAIGQARMVREPVAGIAHIFIFSGFLVVTLGTVTHFVHAYNESWHFPGLGGLGGDIYSLVKDIFEMLVASLKTNAVAGRSLERRRFCFGYDPRFNAH